MQFNLYGKSTRSLNRFLWGLLIVMFLALGIAGIIDNIRNAESYLFILIMTIIMIIIFIILLLKAESDYKKNIIILDDEAIRYQGNKKSSICYYSNIVYMVVTFVNFKTPLVMIVSGKEAYKNQKGINNLPYVLLRHYTHTIISNDFIFFMYNKKAFEMIKEKCNAPIYDEYLLYKKGVEDAV